MPHRGRSNADDTLATLLAAGKSVLDTAAAAGVSARTVHRRLADPDFRRKVRDVRAEMFAQASGQLADTVAEAVETLRRSLRCGNPAVEVRAALGILNVTQAMVVMADLQAELDELRAEVERTRVDARAAMAG